MNEKLAQDLRAIIDDAENILENTAHLNDARITQLRQKIAHRLELARNQLNSLQTEVCQKAKHCAAFADQYVQENPWHAVGIAGIVGLVLGLLLGKR